MRTSSKRHCARCQRVRDYLAVIAQHVGIRAFQDSRYRNLAQRAAKEKDHAAGRRMIDEELDRG